MSLRAFLGQRRYRRLSFALFAALVVHLGLVLTGDWGISLFSTPSNQDRVLTLTLENSTYEGLKETAVDEHDTINESKLGEPADIRPQETPIDKRQESAVENSMPEMARAQEQAEESLKPSSEETTASSDSQTPSDKTLIDQIIADAFSKASLLHEPDDQTELLTSNFPSEIKLAQKPNVDLVDPESIEPVSKKLNPVELEMLDKKMRRWTKAFSRKLDSQEPTQWQEGDQNFEVSFQRIPAKTDMHTDEVMVEVVTKRDGKKLTTSMRLKKMAFSNFAQFVNHWDHRVSIHNDEMDGRFHSNTKISLMADQQGTPLFHGKVTTASYFVDVRGKVSRRELFRAGIETGVKKIAMPKPSVLFAQAHADESVNSILIDKDARIIFLNDGRYLIQTFKEVGAMRPYYIGNRPLYILAAPGVSLTLSGTVNGAVAVYSPKRIIIEGDLVYESSKPIDEGGDFLGLISGRSVVIGKRKKMADGDLNIHAAIYAKSRFEVSQLSGKRVGTLNILGSVSAGTITATEPRFDTKIVFDTRLENLRPPGFPVTDRYEVVASQRQWKLADDPYHESLESLEADAEEENEKNLLSDEQIGDADIATTFRELKPLRVEKPDGATLASSGNEAVQSEESIPAEGSIADEEAASIEQEVDVDEYSQFENYSDD